MKLILAAVTGLGLLFSSLVGLNEPSAPTVTSIHTFEEPLVAIGGDASSNTDSDLIKALQTYQKRKSFEDVSSITAYIGSHPNSPWKFSLLANLGINYRKTGYYSRALDAWEQAWTLGKGEKDVKAQALANQIAADLATLLSSLGRTERLKSLLQKAAQYGEGEWFPIALATQQSPKTKSANARLNHTAWPSIISLPVSLA